MHACKKEQGWGWVVGVGDVLKFRVREKEKKEERKKEQKNLGEMNDTRDRQR